MKSAAANGAVINTVNIMAFDYYDHTTTQMATAAENAATGAVAQLQSIYPAKTPKQLWAMMGITLMPGIDDYPKKTEVTTVDDAKADVAHKLRGSALAVGAGSACAVRSTCSSAIPPAEFA